MNNKTQQVKEKILKLATDMVGGHATSCTKNNCQCDLDILLFKLSELSDQLESTVRKEIKYHLETMVFDDTDEDKEMNIMEFRKQQSNYLDSLTHSPVETPSSASSQDHANVQSNTPEPQCRHKWIEADDDDGNIMGELCKNCGKIRRLRAPKPQVQECNGSNCHCHYGWPCETNTFHCIHCSKQEGEK